jgi:hypothetical protein
MTIIRNIKKAGGQTDSKEGGHAHKYLQLTISFHCEFRPVVRSPPSQLFGRIYFVKSSRSLLLLDNCSCVLNGGYVGSNPAARIAIFWWLDRISFAELG